MCAEAVGCGDEGTASFAIDAVRDAHRHPTAFGGGTFGGFPLLHRLVWPEKPGDFGEHCLSAKRELRSRPAFPVRRGKPEGPVR